MTEEKTRFTRLNVLKNSPWFPYVGKMFCSYRIDDGTVSDLAGQLVARYWPTISWRFYWCLAYERNCKTNTNHLTIIWLTKEGDNIKNEQYKIIFLAITGASRWSVEWLQAIQISWPSGSTSLETRLTWDQKRASRCEAGQTRLWICRITRVSSAIVSNTFICSRVANNYDNKLVFNIRLLLCKC